MISGIAFILHSPADEAYAAELAGALSPLMAFPVALKADGDARPTQYGVGASCIVLWSRDMSAYAQRVLAAMPQSFANALICRADDAHLPDALSASSVLKAQIAGNAAIDAPRVSEALARMRARFDEPVVGSRTTAPALARAGSTVAPAPKTRFAVRSAWGMVATMAVVGVAAPMIANRAGAASNVPADTATTSAAATSVVQEAAAIAVDNAGALVEAAQVAPPEAEAPVFQPAAMTAAREAPAVVDPTIETLTLMLQSPTSATLEAVAPLPTFAEDADTLDSNATAVIAAMVAGSDVSRWKIDATAVDTARSDQKPGSHSAIYGPGK
jgi:hypothetical protein